MTKPFAFLSLFVCLAGCIGTDFMDDPLVPRVLSLTPEDTALRVGETFQLQIAYSNEYGIDEDVQVTYLNFTEGIIAVNNDGTVEAQSIGQGRVCAHLNGVASDTVLVNVVGDSTVVARVEVTGASNQLAVGDSLQLSARTFNIDNAELTGRLITWESGNENIAIAYADGWIVGVSPGTVEVRATSEGVRSAPYAIAVGNTSRMATFVGSSGYKGKGTAVLSESQDGVVTLDLLEDFETDFALGTFIYLSNATSGATTRAEGLELGEVTRNGAHSFNVTDIAAEQDKSVTLDQYRYVIILCKPASITFGIGDFES